MATVRKIINAYREFEVCPYCGETMFRQSEEDINPSVYPLHYAWKCYNCKTEIWTSNNGEVKFDWKY